MTEINHADVAATLHKAADLIEERGWEQGDGWPSNLRSADAPLCLEGGIMAALGMQVDHDDESDEGFREFVACPAYRSVVDYLGREEVGVEDGGIGFTGEPLYWWNDEDAKTASEVIEVLRAAAAIEQAKADAELTKPAPPVLHSHEDGTWTVTYDPTVWAPEFIEALVHSSAADRVRGAVES